MKVLIIVLIIASFLESTIISLDLVLIILICRSFIRPGKSNLSLAFAFGLLSSHLSLTPLGLESITFLVLITITEILSRSRLSQSPFLIIPICSIAIAINQFATVAFTYETLTLNPIIYGGILAFPIFYLIRIWEERFIVRKEIKLRL